MPTAEPELDRRGLHRQPAVVKLGTGGKITLANRSSGTLQVIADIVGYYTDTEHRHQRRVRPPQPHPHPHRHHSSVGRDTPHRPGHRRRRRPHHRRRRRRGQPHRRQRLHQRLPHRLPRRPDPADRVEPELGRQRIRRRPGHGPRLRRRHNQHLQRLHGGTIAYIEGYITSAPASPAPPAPTTYTYNGDGLRLTKTTNGSPPPRLRRLRHRPTLLTDGTRDYIYGPDGTPLEQ